MQLVAHHLHPARRVIVIQHSIHMPCLLYFLPALLRNSGYSDDELMELYHRDLTVCWIENQGMHIHN